MKNLILEELSDRQKVGMLHCARPTNDQDMEEVIRLVRAHELGCVQISAAKPHYVQMVRDNADYPILIICDTETGFPTSSLPKIPLLALSACNKPDYYRIFAKGVVTEAKKAGFNGTWSPVVDILKCNGPCRVSRVFSDDPMRIAKAAEIISTVYKKNGYLSGCKHYPGGKDKPYDGHMAACPCDITEEELIETNLFPYRYLMERDLLPSIMTSHTTYRKIDPDHPGTLSPKVQKIIRKLGFDGITFTDSFAMMAILQKYGEEKVLGLAVAAGNDIVLPNYRTSVHQSHEYLQKNYQEGMFTEERLNEACRRVLTAQEFVGKEPEDPDVFTEEDRKAFDYMARDCITAVLDPGVSAALDPDKKHLFVIVTQQTFTEDADSPEIPQAAWYFPLSIKEKIMKEFPNSTVQFIPEFATKKQNEAVLLASADCDDVVFVTFCDTQAYLGTDCLTRRTEALIDCVNLNGKLAAVVHFGNPFALQPLAHVPRKIFGYTMTAAQPYAIEVLSGKIKAKGTLPFSIDFQ